MGEDSSQRVPVRGAAGDLGQPRSLLAARQLIQNPGVGMGTCLEAPELLVHPVRISTLLFAPSVMNTTVSVFKKQSETEPFVIVHSFVCLMSS